MPLAEVGFVESVVVQIIKALVIFVVILQIAPLILLARAQVARPLPVALRPEPRRPLRARSSRSPTCFKLLSKEQFHADHAASPG